MEPLLPKPHSLQASRLGLATRGICIICKVEVKGERTIWQHLSNYKCIFLFT